MRTVSHESAHGTPCIPGSKIWSFGFGLFASGQTDKSAKFGAENSKPTVSEAMGSSSALCAICSTSEAQAHTIASYLTAAGCRLKNLWAFLKKKHTVVRS